MWSEDRKIIQAANAERERFPNSQHLSERASSPQLPINPLGESSNLAQIPPEAALHPRRKMPSEDQAPTKQKAPPEQAISDEQGLEPAKGTSSYEIPRDDTSYGHHAKDAVCGHHQIHQDSIFSGQRVAISRDNGSHLRRSEQASVSQLQLAKQADELHCDQETLKAIQERWEVAVDLQHAMREYCEKCLGPSNITTVIPANRKSENEPFRRNPVYPGENR
jgi:hypothetical protein